MRACVWFGGFFVCFLLFLVIKSFYFRNSIPVVRAKDGSLPRFPLKSRYHGSLKTVYKHSPGKVLGQAPVALATDQ